VATFTYTPSYSGSVTHSPQVRSVQFGDGYEQRATFGINTDKRIWNLDFRGKDDTDANAITAFLEARGAVESFDWTPPYGDAGKWVCRSWSRTVISNGLSDISVTFEEVFES
jgi:phage-related protein